MEIKSNIIQSALSSNRVTVTECKFSKVISVLLAVVVMFTLGLFVAGCNTDQPVSGTDELINDVSNKIDLQETPVRSTTPTRAEMNVACVEAKGRDLSLCNFTEPGWKENNNTVYPFEITYAEVDLDGDGVNEDIVWESSWSGTSGGALVALATNKTGFLKKFETEMTWSPIIVLPTKHHGWNDVAYLQNGGGVKTEFLIAEYNGKSYSVKATSETQPEGEIVIEKNWKGGYFGPMKN